MANQFYQNGSYSGPSVAASPEVLRLLAQASEARDTYRTAVTEAMQRDPWALSARDQGGAYGKAQSAYDSVAKQEKPTTAAPDGYHWGLHGPSGEWRAVRNTSLAGPFLKSIGLPALAFGGAALLAPAAAGGLGGAGAFGTAGMAGATGAASAALPAVGALSGAAGAVGGGAPAVGGAGAAAGAAGAAKGAAGVAGAAGGLSTAGKIAGGAMGVLGMLDQRSQRGAAENFLNSQLELRKRQLALAEQDYAGRAPMRAAGQQGLMALAQALGPESSVFRNRRAGEAAGNIGG